VKADTGLRNQAQGFLSDNDTAGLGAFLVTVKIPVADVTPSPAVTTTEVKDDAQEASVSPVVVFVGAVAVIGLLIAARRHSE